MSTEKHTRRRLRDNCGQLNPDDNIDPRDYFRGDRKPGRFNRKTMQLSRQIAETLDMVLTGECNEEQLYSLRVMSVQPAPDASQFLVSIQSTLPRDQVDREEIHRLLEIHTGHFRYEVAGAITRKRAPSLIFQLIEPLEPGSEQGNLFPGSYQSG